MRKGLGILDRKEDILEWINNQGASGHKTIVGKKSALELLADINISDSRKRRRLIEDGIKENKCECCGLS